MENNNKNNLIDSLEKIDQEFIDSAADISLGIPPKKGKRQYLRYLGLAAAAALLLIAMLSLVLLNNRRPGNTLVTTGGIPITGEITSGNEATSNPSAFITTNEFPVTTKPTLDGEEEGFIIYRSPEVTQFYDKDLYSVSVLGLRDGGAAAIEEKNSSLKPFNLEKNSLGIDINRVISSIDSKMNFMFSPLNSIWYNGDPFHYENYVIIMTGIYKNANSNSFLFNVCIINGKVDTEDGTKDIKASVVIEVDISE